MPLNNSIDLLEQPCHVLADGLHGARHLLVLLDLVLGRVDASSFLESVKKTDEWDVLICSLDLPDRTS